MNWTHSLQAFSPELGNLSLPTDTAHLFSLFQNSSSHLIKICALTKIKHQLLSSLEQDVGMPDSERIQAIFSSALLNYLRVNRLASKETKAERKMLFHLISLGIKYYFSEAGFKRLLAQVTDIIDGHVYRVEPSLSFFSQIIVTIEYSREEQRSNQRCRFERHLTNDHINSMLTLANFCLQRGMLQENTSLEDGPPEESFQIRASEETLAAGLHLVRVCLCFDWQGEKYNEFQEISQMASLVIPTKKARQTTENEFDKWLKSSEWVRMYQLIFQEAQSVRLRLEVVELLGDMARIHMKYFKNKANYRVHIQNIVYAFSKILEDFQILRNSQESIQVALALAVNLNKLVGGCVGSIIFDINVNFSSGLFQSLKKFIIYQIIGEEIFNSNLIFFYFRFFEAVLTRSRFQRNNLHFENLEEVLREICRSYEQYLRILLNKVRKTPIRLTEPLCYRLDYAQLKEHLKYYDWRELQVYFLPFRLMKPRYVSNSTIFEIFVYICARICRAASLLEMFKMQPWEKEVAYSMISQSVQKLQERFSFTSYRKLSCKKDYIFNDSQEGLLPPISEHFQEEIQNQEEYCHILRLSCFMVMAQLQEMSASSLMKVAASVVKLVVLTLELCLNADLQEKDNQQAKTVICHQKIAEGLEMCSILCRKAYLKEYERYLINAMREAERPHPIRYQYQFAEAEFSVIDLELQTETSILLKTVSSLLPQKDKVISTILFEIRMLATISLESQWKSAQQKALSSVESCLVCLETICSSEVLMGLVNYRQSSMMAFLSALLNHLQKIDIDQGDLPMFIKILRIMVQLKIAELSEFALNKLYVALKCLIPFLKEENRPSQHLVEQLTAVISCLLICSQERDLQELAQELQTMLTGRKGSQRMELETTCLSGSPKLANSMEQVIDCDVNSVQALIQPPEPAKKLELQQLVVEESLSKEEDRDERREKEEFKVYQGYHRHKTLSMLSKYVNDQENEKPDQIDLRLSGTNSQQQSKEFGLIQESKIEDDEEAGSGHKHRKIYEDLIRDTPFPEIENEETAKYASSPSVFHNHLKNHQMKNSSNCELDENPDPAEAKDSYSELLLQIPENIAVQSLECKEEGEPLPTAEQSIQQQSQFLKFQKQIVELEKTDKKADHALSQVAACGIRGSDNYAANQAGTSTQNQNSPNHRDSMHQTPHKACCLQTITGNQQQRKGEEKVGTEDGDSSDKSRQLMLLSSSSEESGKKPIESQ